MIVAKNKRINERKALEAEESILDMLNEEEVASELTARAIEESCTNSSFMLLTEKYGDRKVSGASVYAHAKRSFYLPSRGEDCERNYP